MFVSIIVGSDFGGREAIYKVVENRLVLRDEGDHDNLAGNGEVCDYEGMTIEQAQDKIKASNAEPVGHAYDGCHACTRSIRLCQLKDEDVPHYLTYNEPSEVFVIREALKKFRNKR